MKLIGYTTGRLYFAFLFVLVFVFAFNLINFFTLLGKFKKTRGVSIKNIKGKSNLCDLNIVLRLSQAFG